MRFLKLNNRRALCRLKNVMLFAVVSIFASCVSDDTDFSSIIDDKPGADYELKDIQIDNTPLSEQETIPADDNDYVENSDLTRTVNISFNGNAATVETTVTGITPTIDGAHVVINSTRKSVNYVVTGSTDNGSLKIYSENKFQLTLNGVNITNPHGAAINNQCGKTLYVTLASGTTNTLVDGTTYQTPDNEDEKGTFFSEGQIIFNGNGTLNVTGRSHNGIASDDYIIFRPGNVIEVNSAGKNCIKANDGIFIRGGVLNLNSTGAGGKCINSEANVEVSGGRLTAIASGSSYIDASDTTNVAALKCDSSFVMTGGEVNLKSTADSGKGLNSNGDVTIYDGELYIETFGSKGLSSPKGLKCDGVATFEGGKSSIYSANSSPIDAEKGMIYAPTLSVTHSKDGKFVAIAKTTK